MPMYYPVSLERLVTVLDPFYEDFSSNYIKAHLEQDSSEKKMSKAQQIKLEKSLEQNAAQTLQKQLYADTTLSGVYLSYLESLEFKPITRQEIKEALISYLNNEVNNNSSINNNNNINDSISKRQQHLDNIIRIVTSYDEDYIISFDVNYKKDSYLKSQDSNDKDTFSITNSPYSYEFTSLEDLYNYIAMVYRKESIVYCLPNDESVYVTQALGIEFKDGDKMEFTDLPSKDKVTTVSWTLDDDALNYTWKNPEFVLDKIKETKVNSIDSIAFLSLVDPSIFKDEDFLQKACSYSWFAEFLVSNNIKTSFEVIQFVPDNINIITTLWNKTSFDLNVDFIKSLAKPDGFNKKSLHDIMLDATISPQHLAASKLTDDIANYNDLERVMGKYQDHDRMSFDPKVQIMYLHHMYETIKSRVPDYENPGLPSFYNTNINYEEIDIRSLRASMQEDLYYSYLNQYTESYEKAQEVKQFLITNVFNNQEKVVKFLDNANYIDYSILKLIPDNIISQPEISILFLSRPTKFMANEDIEKVLSLIPHTFYTEETPPQNINRKNAFINMLIDHCDNSQKIASIIKDYDWLNTREGISQTLHDYIDCPTTINQKKNKVSNLGRADLEKLYNAFPSPLDKAPEVVKACLYVNKTIFKLFSKNLQNNPDILTYYFKLGGEVDSSHEDLVFALTDKQLVANILSSDSNYRLLKSPNCPNDWRTNIDLLLSVKTHIAELNLSSAEWETIYSNKNFKTQNLTNTLFQNNPDFYKKLPDRLKEDLALTHNYIRATKDLDENCVQSIPKVMWSYQCICLAIISKNYKLAKNIPKLHWQDKKFLRSFFNSLDSNMTNKRVINYMPEEIRQCLTVFQIESNFTAFFNSFSLQQDLQNKIEDKPVSKQKKKI